VFLTRTERERSYTDVLLQNVRVLGIDQIADDRTDKPKVAKAVTLELTTEAAQKVVLAASVGSISLSLRSVGVADRRLDNNVIHPVFRLLPPESGCRPTQLRSFPLLHERPRPMGDFWLPGEAPANRSPF
jgi:Flp pilus assembly protein CpaB